MSERSEVESLLSLAEDDLEIARRSLKGKRKLLWTACFHAQQSAEKALKAFLSSQGEVFPKSHDLVELVMRCEKYDANFTFIVPLCHLLNPYAVKVRYTEELELNLTDARNAITAAKEIKDFVQKKIPAKYRSRT